MPELRDFVRVSRKLYVAPGEKHKNQKLAGDVANQLRKAGVKINTKLVGKR